MEWKIIKSPSPGTIDILMRRKGSPASHDMSGFDAVGLVQGRLIDMIVAADIAEKAAGVFVEDIRGSCPQNLIVIAHIWRYGCCRGAIADICRVFQDTGR